MLPEERRRHRELFYYRRAAALGSAEAEFRIGRRLHVGVGIAADVVAAAQHYARACGEFSRAAFCR
jgi:TPR repeat protein